MVHHQKTNHSKDVFTYFQKLSAHIGFMNRGKSILQSQYEKLRKPNPKSVLHHYVSHKEITNRENDTTPRFPFGVNLSQREAVGKALDNSVSIIEGPPGTGKTQTILNIIANVVAPGQTVGIVSGNNSATENVQEKLEEYGFGFMTALLRNYQNRKDFFENNQPSIPNMSGWKLDKKDLEKHSVQLQSLSETLNVLLEDQRKMAKLKDELSKLKVEQTYFEEHFKGNYIETNAYSFYKN